MLFRSDDQKFQVMDRICQQLTAEGATLSTIDGVRVSRINGWWLLRASNTQPVLVMRFEASTEAQLAEYQNEVEKALAAAKA